MEGALTTRHDLIHWVFDLHNNVNEQLGKPRITFQAYVAHMQELAAAPYTKLPSTGASNNLIAIAAIVGIAGAGYYFYNRNK